MTDTFSFSPQAIAEWGPFAKAAGFFLATFILEDVATVGAGLLLATGGISWPGAFAACFLGVWIGDASLYALARFAGRSWFERSSLRRFAPKVARSQRWFAERGTPILIFSRMVPGARLPTYLAAGFLRVPLPRFLAVTGAAAFVWTLTVLCLAKTFGERLVYWLNAYKHAGVWLVAAGVVIFVLLQWLRRAVANFDSRQFSAWLSRWTHWEFWPAWMFYPPVAVYCLWLAIKYRGLTLPTAANPGIFSGGLVGESKMATLRDLLAANPEFTAAAGLISAGTVEKRLSEMRSICERHDISYPFILKPDVGQRGVGIKLIRDESQAVEYLKQTGARLVVQRYAEGPNEIGVFYYRFPHEPRGHVFGITEKVFPSVMGDGVSTVTELIWRDPRARLIAGKYLRRFASRQEEILPAGTSLKLVEAGNHAQGCIFRDGMRLCTTALVERIDGISRAVPGFYIGRFDIRYRSQAELRAGENFQIIELNGAASEATSIYDARNSLWSAYRQLFRQWELVFAIGAANRQSGCPSTKLSLIWRKWREYIREAASYPAAD